MNLSHQLHQLWIDRAEVHADLSKFARQKFFGFNLKDESKLFQGGRARLHFAALPFGDQGLIDVQALSQLALSETPFFADSLE
jgi:hypothetical protein